MKRSAIFLTVYFFVAAILSASPSFSETATLLKDINDFVFERGSDPSNFYTIGNVTFFTAEDRQHGRELWRTDGTFEGTYLVKDIVPGAESAFYFGNFRSTFFSSNGILYFSPDEGPQRRKFWRSDGTEEGTFVLKDISVRPISPIIFQSNWIAENNGTLFFIASDQINGWQLWKSDGTEAGTVPITTSGFNLGIGQFIIVNGVIYFREGFESPAKLWKSDGTEAGTVLVKDFGVSIGNFVENQGFLYVTTKNGLWKSDGTLAGTVLIKEIPEQSFPIELKKIGSSFFFFTGTYSTGVEVDLWKSDGTVAGTTVLKNFSSITQFGGLLELVDVNGMAFFIADDGISGLELWRSDGTVPGTVIVKDIVAGPENSVFGFLTNVNGTLYFWAESKFRERSLWKSDGTESGTERVKTFQFTDVVVGEIGYAGPKFLHNGNGTLLFAGDDSGQAAPSNVELWKSDGTEAGTQMIKDIHSGIINNNSGPYGLTVLGNSMFFSASGNSGSGLWKTDGTEAGTTQIFDKQSWVLDEVNEVLYLLAWDPSQGRELWKTDGTQEGTVLIKEIIPGPTYPIYKEFTGANDLLFFSATDTPTHNPFLWKSDGTETGTLKVKNSLGETISNPRFLTEMNGVLYFNSPNAPNGIRLWRSDGTEAGTRIIVSESSNGPFNPHTLIDFNGSLLFFGSSDQNGVNQGIWISDGTNAGTRMIKPIGPEGPFFPEFLTKVNGTLFFSASPTNSSSSRELWKSDGTGEGTVLIKDIFPGQQSSKPDNLTNVGGTLFFSAGDGVTGLGLWKSDGTEEGTLLVKNLSIRSSISSSGSPVGGNGIFFFSAFDPEHGTELWKSDGSAKGTVLVNDLSPFSSESFPNYLTPFKDRLFFVAHRWDVGFEIWSIPLPPKNKAHNDFDLNSNSDLLEVNTTSGETKIGLLNRSNLFSETSIVTEPPGTGWAVNSTGDFNGDMKADLLLYNTTTGDHRMILLDGSTILSDTTLLTLPPSFGLVPWGTGDFNGDGRDEIIGFDPATGFTIMIFMDADGVFSSLEFVTQVDVANNWTLHQTGDYNGDGKTDLLLYNTVNGETLFLQMDGSTVDNFVGLLGLDPASGWKLEETADFDNNGSTDLLFVLNSSLMAVITLENGAISSFYVPGAVPANQEIVNAGDYDADGDADLLYFNPTTGDVSIAFMESQTITTEESVTTLDTAAGWKLHSGRSQ